MKTQFGIRGFTLVELMVTLAIAAILMMVAIPSLTTYRRNAELSAATNSFVGMLGSARGEAMKRSKTIVIIPASGAYWGNGWIAFIDNNYDGVYTATTDTLITRRDEVFPSYLIVGDSANLGYLRYNGSGYAVTNSGGFLATTINISRNDVPTTEILSSTRRIKISSVGRVRVCNPSTSTGTNCTDSSTSSTS